MTDKCFLCQAELTADERALYARLIDRCASEFLCYDCLAQKLNVPKEALIEKVELFKSQGCAMFS